MNWIENEMASPCIMTKRRMMYCFRHFLVQVLLILLYLARLDSATYNSTYQPFIAQPSRILSNSSSEDPIELERELSYSYYDSHNNEAYCGIWSDTQNFYLNNFLYDSVRFFVRDGANSWEFKYFPNGAGANIVKYSSSTGNCELSHVGIYSNEDSSSLIAAINALTDGDIVMFSIKQTGDGFSSDVITTLQARLGATVTSFPVLATYVLIAQYYSTQPGVSYCESGPNAYTSYNDETYGDYMASDSTCKHYFNNINSTLVTPSEVPTEAPTGPTEAPTEGTTEPTGAPTGAPSVIPTVVPSTVKPTAVPTTASYIISTIAGTTSKGFSSDNVAATTSKLSYLQGIALDSSGKHSTTYVLSIVTNFHILGNVYIGDTTNHRVRKVTASTGIITTIAGTGTGIYSGDGGQATSATLKNPSGVAVDSSGNDFSIVIHILVNSLVICTT